MINRITAYVWLDNYSQYKPEMTAFKNGIDNADINDILYICNLHKLCTQKDKKSEFAHLMKNNLIAEAIMNETGLTIKEAMESKNKEIRVAYRNIKQYYSSMIPRQLYYNARNAQWCKDFLGGLMSDIISAMGEGVKPFMFTRYSDIENYCIQNDSMYHTNLYAVYEEKKKELKDKGYSRMEIINKLGILLCEG